MSKAEKKSTGTAKMLIASIACLAMGGGGTWFYFNNVANAGANTQAPAGAATPQQMTVSAQPVFLELEPFTVTLNNGSQTRVLYTGLTLRFQDEASRDRTKQYMPVVRSRVLSELSDLDPSTVNNRATKEALQARLKQLVTAPFAPDPSVQYVSDVLFTAYVVQ